MQDESLLGKQFSHNCNDNRRIIKEKYAKLVYCYTAVHILLQLNY